MNAGRIVFSQLMDVIPRNEFRKLVTHFKGNYRARSFTCWDQLLCLCFGQLTFRQSLRDLTSTLNALGAQRYHMGIRNTVPRSTFADANARRSWRIYHGLALILIEHARKLYSNDSDVTKAETVFALDSTTIDLCLSLFPWAESTSRRGAIKLHTLMDLEGSIPTFIHISNARLHDSNALDLIPVTAGGIYILDRGYFSFERLYNLHLAGGRFVVRARKNLQFYRKSSTPVDRSLGLSCDQIIRLTGYFAKHRYPLVLRRVHVLDRENDQDLVLLSNLTDCSAQQISTYYKQRWQIELFFKWIKQNLRIKAFYGQSPNAVKTQIWTAICTYLIIIIVKKNNRIDANLHTMMQVLSVAILQRTTLNELFCDPELTDSYLRRRNQLGLFDL